MVKHLPKKLPEHGHVMPSMLGTRAKQETPDLIGRMGSVIIEHGAVLGCQFRADNVDRPKT